METGKHRVPFGNETRYQVVTTSCPSCNAGKGQLHEYGCPVEACPECGKLLLTCNCKALGIIDTMKLTSAIANGITDRAEIHRALDRGTRHLDKTYFEEGVMAWIVRDLTERDPAAREMMNDFLADMGFKPVGNHYVTTADNVAAHLDVPKEEAHEILNALQAGAVFPDLEEWDGPVH